MSSTSLSRKQVGFLILPRFTATYPSAACPHDVLPTSETELLVHVYQPSEEETAEEMTGGSGDAPGDEVMAASVSELPSRTLEGLW